MRALVAVISLAAGFATCSSAAPVPDFRLMDVNRNSPRRNTWVSPRDYRFQVSGYYFGAAHCSYCNSQFGYLNNMLAELRATNTALNIEILGINQIGDEASNSLPTAGRSLPWLQDTSQDDIRSRWGAQWRDVFILDSLNQVAGVLNLTTHDLANSQNRAALKQMFLNAAQAADSDHDHLPDDWETHYFESLSQGAGDDPDHDGCDNFTEFAFGTDPKDAKSFQGGSIAFNGASSQIPISIAFRRRTGSLLQYSFESSRNLTEWSPAPPALLAVQYPESLFDGTGAAVVHCFPTIHGWSDGASFIRIRATPALNP
ncbi:MAG: hypothetical protein U1G07_04060 [Verrucomicrobiota bacterium]